MAALLATCHDECNRHYQRCRTRESGASPTSSSTNAQDQCVQQRATMARKTAVVVVGVHMWCCPMTAWGRHCRWSSPPAVWDRRDAGSRARRPWQRDGPTMCGRPTSCCRIAFRQRLLINLTNWHTGSLCLNRSIKVTEDKTDVKRLLIQNPCRTTVHSAATIHLVGPRCRPGSESISILPLLHPSQSKLSIGDKFYRP